MTISRSLRWIGNATARLPSAGATAIRTGSRAIAATAALAWRPRSPQTGDRCFGVVPPGAQRVRATPRPALSLRRVSGPGAHRRHPDGKEPLADETIRARTWSDAARFSGAISDDGGAVVATEHAFVADYVRLRLAARARHDVIRNGGSLRPHGTEAKHRAAAGRMPVAGPVLVVVAIPGHRNVMRMRCRSGSVIVLMHISGLIALMLALRGYVEGDRDREGRRHRREQVSDGDKPSPPSSPRLSQANHPCTCCPDREHIALVAGTANRKRRMSSRQDRTDAAPHSSRGILRPAKLSSSGGEAHEIFFAIPVMKATCLRRLGQ